MEAPVIAGIIILSGLTGFAICELLARYYSLQDKRRLYDDYARPSQATHPLAVVQRTAPLRMISWVVGAVLLAPLNPIFAVVILVMALLHAIACHSMEAIRTRQQARVERCTAWLQDTRLAAIAWKLPEDVALRLLDASGGIFPHELYVRHLLANVNGRPPVDMKSRSAVADMQHSVERLREEIIEKVMDGTWASMSAPEDE